jgi:hypothetical protein
MKKILIVSLLLFIIMHSNAQRINKFDGVLSIDFNFLTSKGFENDPGVSFQFDGLFLPDKKLQPILNVGFAHFF